MTNRIPLILLLLAAILPAGEGRSESTFDQERCSLCHIRDSMFFSASFLSPEELKGFDEERLCGSCHNGSVQDDRAQLWRGSQHPAVGGGREKRCSRCHSPHSKGGWGVLAGTNVSLRRGGDALCTGCHATFQDRAGTLHGKRLDGGCKECHQVHGGQGKSLLRDAGGGPCLRCHGDMGSKREGGHPATGAAAADGASPGARIPGCLGCHPAHRAGDAAAVRRGSCSGCHPFGASDTRRPGKGHEREEDCEMCHTFHSRAGKGGKGYRGKDLRVDILCGGCHSRYWAGDIQAGKSSGTHVSVAGDKSDICFRCHRIHDAPADTPLLRSAKSYSCLECHERQNTIRETGGIVLAHPVFEKVTRGRLTAVSMEKQLPVGPMGEIVCRTCHKVHFAAAGTPLLTPGTEKAESCFWCHEGMRGKPHKGKGTGADCSVCHPVHGRKETGGDPWAVLCQTCHPRPSIHRAGKEDRSVGRSAGLPEFDSRGRKTPYGTISCPTCHQPHGEAAELRRVRKNYRPNGFLCTSCHRKEETIALTPHDMRGVAGNSVCEPCHVPHGGSSPWMWGLRRAGGEASEEVCRACHEGKGMGTPVPKGGHPRNMIPSRPLPDRFPLLGPDGAVSRVGVISCTTCHEVHGSGMMPTGQGVGKLLRRNGEVIPSAMCAECHAGKDDRHGKAECLACHPPHSGSATETACARCHGDRQGSLLAKHRDAGKGCGSCHRMHEVATGRKGDGEIPGARGCYGCHPAVGRIAGTPHAEMGGSACEPCHPIHGDLPKFTFRPKLGEEVFSPDLSCIRCHREGGDAPIPKWSLHPNRTQEVPTNYGAKVKLETPIMMVGKHREGGRPLFPLFDEAGKPGMAGRMGCLTCHDPHAGGQGGRASGPSAYLRDPSLAFLSDVCAPCHRGDGVARIKEFHTRPRGNQ